MPKKRAVTASASERESHGLFFTISKKLNCYDFFNSALHGIGDIFKKRGLALTTGYVSLSCRFAGHERIVSFWDQDAGRFLLTGTLND